MKAPKRRRPLSRARVEPPEGTDLAQLASRASYVISPEHKDYLTEAGPGRLRSDATPCPRDVTRDQAEAWLRRSLAAGYGSGPWGADSYPQYVWHRQGDAVFEARLTNSEQGAYKGYPLEPAEWPGWLP